MGCRLLAADHDHAEVDASLAESRKHITTTGVAAAAAQCAEVAGCITGELGSGYGTQLRSVAWRANHSPVPPPLKYTP